MDENFIYLELLALPAQPGALAQGTPPSEFRIFRAGENHTRKGTFKFDAAAAESVLARSEAWGVEHAIDYNHAMVAGSGADPALAGRAAGWFKLGLRDGELWATDVRWTPTAHKALSDGEWRYISPTFTHTKEGRVTELLNVAITNLPATHKLDPLVSLSLIQESKPVADKRRVMDEALLIALGLAKDASESDAVAKATALLIESGKVASLSAEVASLRTELGAAREELARDRATKLAAEVDAAIADGRATPAQRETLVKLAETHPEMVRGLLSAAPKIVKMEDPARREPVESAKASAATLTDTDKRVAKLLGLDAKQLESMASLRAEFNSARAAL